MPGNRIVLVVDFQSQSANQNITQLNSAIGQIGTTANQASNTASAGINKLTVTVDQATRSINGLLTSLTGLGLAAATKAWFDYGNAIQTANFALTQAFGAEKTAQITAQIRTIAHESGNSEQALVKVAQTLGATFRVPAEKIPAMTQVFVDFAAKMGVGQDRIDEMAQAFGRMSAAGFISARELKRGFENMGIDAIGFITQLTGKHRSEVQKILSGDGADIKFTMDFILGKMQQMSEGTAKKMLAAIPAKQLQATLNELGDVALKTFVLMQPAIEKVIEGMRDLVAIVYTLVGAYQKLDPQTQTIIKDLALLALALAALNPALKLLTSLWGLLAGIVSTVISVFGGLGTAVTAVGGALRYLVVAIETLVGILALPEEAFIAIIAGIATLTAIIVSGGIGNAIRQLGVWWDWLKDKTAGAVKVVTDSYEKLKKMLFGQEKGGIGVDTEELQRAIEEAEGVLAQAQARRLKEGKEGIAALVVEYEHYFEKAKGYEQALAIYRLALHEDVAAQIVKRTEEADKTIEKNNLESLRLQRQMRVTAAESIPDSTYAGQQKVADLRAQAFRDQANAEYAIEAANIDKQLAKDKQGALDAAKLAHDNAYTINRDVAILNEKANGEKISAAQKTALIIAEHDLQAVRETNQLIEQERKQHREQELSDQLDYAQKNTNLQIELIRAVDKQTLPEKKQAIQDVEDLQEAQIAHTRQLQLQGVEDQLEDYKKAHADFQAGIDQATRDAARDRVMIERQANYDIGMDRLNSWRETNSAIIEEQKRVYEGFKSSFDKVWDAMFDRSKSFWQSISNAAKTAMQNALKEMVTSRAAGALTQIVTGKGVSFPGGMRGFGGQAPKFEGAGAPPVQSMRAEIDSTFKYQFKDFVQPMEVAAAGLGTSAQLLTGSAQALVGAAQALAASATVGGIGGSPAQVAAAVQQVQNAGGTVGGGGIGGGGISSPALMQAQMGGGASGAMSPADIPIPMTTPQTFPSSLPGISAPGASPSAPPRVPGMGSRMGEYWGIGQTITLPGGGTVPWSSASTGQKLGSILSSQGMAATEATIGTGLFMGGLGKKGVGAGLQTIAGGAMGAIGLGGMFGLAGDLGVSAGLGLAGAGLGLAAVGLKHGGYSGLAMSVGGSALTGAMVGSMFLPGLGTLGGALIGAAIGGIAGTIRLLNPGLEQRIPDEVRRVYGVNITNQSVISQIADVIRQKYGGTLSVGIYSPEVQDLVRLYSLSTGQFGQANLPRPMYGAAFQQSGAGGLQLQPVYSGGQLVASPYSGTTTTQMSNALYLQLHPEQAAALFSGQVINVLSNNPTVVGNANATAINNGSSRVAQGSGLLEPMTVTM